MMRIKRINEMSNNYTMKGLVLGDELEGKYQMTNDGIQAVYQAMYRDNEINIAVEFANDIIDNVNVDENAVLDYLRTFLYDKMVWDASEKDILDTIYNGYHLNYLKNNSMFENDRFNHDYKMWVNEVANLLGIKI